jgi:hypothetical protein
MAQELFPKLLFFERLPIPPKGPYNHAFLEAFLARFLAPH